MSFLAEYIMRGRMQAISLVSLLAFVLMFMNPVFASFIILVSSACIALVTLRKGGREGMYVLLIASAITAALRALLEGDMMFAAMMIASCLTMWLPVWLVALILRETRLLSFTVEIAILLTVLLVVAFYVYNSEPALVWQQMFEPLLQSLPKDAPIDVQEMRNGFNTASHYMTGVSAAGSLFGVLFSLFLARWWQSVLYNPDGFRQEFINLRTGSRLAIISILIIAVAKLASGWLSELAWNITILLAVLYVFIGTAVLHTLFSKMQQSKYLVPMLYITLFLVPHFMLPVALVGLCDAWLNLRKIPSAPNRSGG